MVTALEAAAALNAAAVVDSGEGVVLPRMHKLLYYAQGMSYATTGGPLFDGEFVARTHGPELHELAVLADEVERYRIWEALQAHERTEEDLLARMRDILKVFGGLSTQALANAVHGERPWQRAREGLAWADPDGRLIEPFMFIDFFVDAVDVGGDIMEELALKSPEDRPSWERPFLVAVNVKRLVGHPMFSEVYSGWLRAQIDLPPEPDEWRDGDFRPLEEPVHGSHSTPVS